MAIPPIDTRRQPVTDVLHGVEIADPYRWLEDGDSADVSAWVGAQNARTREALDDLPSRDVWHRRLVELMSVPVVQAVQLRGNRMFVLEREAGAQQARLVARALDDPSTDPVVIADPADGVDDAAIAIDWFHASDDGELVAFGISEGGTENSVLHVARASDGQRSGEAIPNCRAASVAWEPDGSGFFYTRYPDGDQYHRTVHHHRLGDDHADDPVIWAEHPNPQAWPMITLSPDGQRLLVSVMLGWSRHDHHLLDRRTSTWTDIVTEVDAITQFAFAGDDRLVGATTLDAPRGRAVSVELDGDDLGPSSWRTVIGERDSVLGTPVPTADGFVVTTSTVGVDTIERWRFTVGRDGAVEPVEVDEIGVMSVMGLVADTDTDVVLAIVSGFDEAPSVWRVGVTNERVHPVAEHAAVAGLAVSHVSYPSLDGTEIGMFLVHRADTVPSPDTPAILNGYGGFAIAETPMWSPTIAAWCASGGLYAIAGLRGGFEHGEDWHQAGRRERKQNVFDDFHAGGDWLVSTGRTSRERLAIAGGSNGGLLVGAALTQRPDLCRAVWCAVPLLDMIRFPHFLIARLWTDEYGDPDVAEEFEWIHAYSPYHGVVEGTSYPAVLLTTAEGDTRVDPMHARKMAALLQHAGAEQDERPILLHQEGRAGHGVGKPVGKRAAEQADVLAFFSWQLGHRP